jgi:NitT/TauT family transport system permease protein
VTNAAEARASLDVAPESKTPNSWEIAIFSVKQWLKSSAPYLNILGIASFILLWYATTEYFKLPWFKKLPGPVGVFKEWVSKDPAYGMSIYTPEYYSHILKSVWRVVQAFFLATFLGVPIGLLMGWKKIFKDFAFPLLETLRPIPMLAWVPLAILMWPGREESIIFSDLSRLLFRNRVEYVAGSRIHRRGLLSGCKFAGRKASSYFFQDHSARSAALHFYRAANQHGFRVVLAGGW